MLLQNQLKAAPWMTSVFLWGKHLRAVPLPLETWWHITALPRNYTWHRLPTAVPKLITAQPEWTLLTLATPACLLISCHDVFHIMGKVNDPRTKRQRRHRGLCSVLLFFCLWVPKVSVYAGVKAPDGTLSEQAYNKKQDIWNLLRNILTCRKVHLILLR